MPTVFGIINDLCFMTDWTDFAGTPTLELITLIQKRKDPDHRSISESAFHTFMFRFAKELSQKSEIICRNWRYTKDDAIEITSRTFKRFWKYPTFKLAKASCDNVDQAVLLYLFQIARHVLADYHKECNGINVSPYDGSEVIVSGFPFDSNIEDCGDFSKPHEHYDVVRKALSTLSEKHTVIFLTYKAYEIDGKKLPRHLLNSLRSNLGLSQATIRSYKNEAYNKVNEYLNIYGLKTNN